MKLKQGLFCILVIVGCFIVSKPLNWLLPELATLTVYADQLKQAVIALVLIAGITTLAKQKLLLITGGFVSHHFNTKYFLLLIPIAYPGVIFFSSFDKLCYPTIEAFAILLCVRIIKAVFEEVLFRGLIQGYLLKNTNLSVYKVCLTTAVLFALIHLVNFQFADTLSVLTQLIYAFFLGLLFSSLMIALKNVWALGITHGLLNFIATKCDQEFLPAIDETTSFQEYLTSLGGMTIMLSPLLLISWILIRLNLSKEPQKT